MFRPSRASGAWTSARRLPSCVSRIHARSFPAHATIARRRPSTTRAPATTESPSSRRILDVAPGQGFTTAEPATTVASTGTTSPTSTTNLFSGAEVVDGRFRHVVADDAMPPHGQRVADQRALDVDRVRRPFDEPDDDGEASDEHAGEPDRLARVRVIDHPRDERDHRGADGGERARRGMELSRVPRARERVRHERAGGDEDQDESRREGDRRRSDEHEPGGEASRDRRDRDQQRRDVGRSGDVQGRRPVHVFRRGQRLGLGAVTPAALAQIVEPVSFHLGEGHGRPSCRATGTLVGCDCFGGRYSRRLSWKRQRRATCVRIVALAALSAAVVPEAIVEEGHSRRAQRIDGRPARRTGNLTEGTRQERGPRARGGRISHHRRGPRRERLSTCEAEPPPGPRPRSRARR